MEQENEQTKSRSRRRLGVGARAGLGSRAGAGLRAGSVSVKRSKSRR